MPSRKPFQESLAYVIETVRTRHAGKVGQLFIENRTLLSQNAMWSHSITLMTIIMSYRAARAQTSWRSWNIVVVGRTFEGNTDVHSGVSTQYRIGSKVLYCFCTPDIKVHRWHNIGESLTPKRSAWSLMSKGYELFLLPWSISYYTPFLRSKDLMFICIFTTAYKTV